MRFAESERVLFKFFFLSTGFWIFFQRWNNKEIGVLLQKLCPLETNLPAPSFYPSQIGAGQEGQTLNPRAALEAEGWHADQCSRGHAVDELREGSLLGEQFVSDALDSCAGVFPPLLVRYFTTTSQARGRRWVGPLIQRAPRFEHWRRCPRSNHDWQRRQACELLLTVI